MFKSIIFVFKDLILILSTWLIDKRIFLILLIASISFAIIFTVNIPFQLEKGIIFDIYTYNYYIS